MKTTDEEAMVKEEERINLFPNTAQALEVLSKIFSMTEEDLNSLTGEDREIAERPMLFLAQKMCSELGVWSTDLIEYIAFLNRLDIRTDHGDCFIKIERGLKDEG